MEITVFDTLHARYEHRYFAQKSLEHGAPTNLFKSDSVSFFERIRCVVIGTLCLIAAVFSSYYLIICKEAWRTVFEGKVIRLLNNGLLDRGRRSFLLQDQEPVEHRIVLAFSEALSSSSFDKTLRETERAAYEVDVGLFISGDYVFAKIYDCFGSQIIDKTKVDTFKMDVAICLGGACNQVEATALLIESEPHLSEVEKLVWVLSALKKEHRDGYRNVVVVCPKDDFYNVLVAVAYLGWKADSDLSNEDELQSFLSNPALSCFTEVFESRYKSFLLTHWLEIIKSLNQPSFYLEGASETLDVGRDSFLNPFFLEKTTGYESSHRVSQDVAANFALPVVSGIVSSDFFLEKSSFSDINDQPTALASLVGEMVVDLDEVEVSADVISQHALPLKHHLRPFEVNPKILSDFLPQQLSSMRAMLETYPAFLAKSEHRHTLSTFLDTGVSGLFSFQDVFRNVSGRGTEEGGNRLMSVGEGAAGDDTLFIQTPSLDIHASCDQLVQTLAVTSLWIQQALQKNKKVYVICGEDIESHLALLCVFKTLSHRTAGDGSLRGHPCENALKVFQSQCRTLESFAVHKEKIKEGWSSIQSLYEKLALINATQPVSSLDDLFKQALTVRAIQSAVRANQTSSEEGNEILSAYDFLMAKGLAIHVFEKHHGLDQHGQPLSVRLSKAVVGCSLGINQSQIMALVLENLGYSVEGVIAGRNGYCNPCLIDRHVILPSKAGREANDVHFFASFNKNRRDRLVPPDAELGGVIELSRSHVWQKFYRAAFQKLVEENGVFFAFEGSILSFAYQLAQAAQEKPDLNLRGSKFVILNWSDVVGLGDTLAVQDKMLTTYRDCHSIFKLE